jgi:membrane-bound lytic murein transglycosylase B
MEKRLSIRALLVPLFLWWALLAPAQAAEVEATDGAARFASCVHSLRAQAREQGVSPAVVDEVLGQVEYQPRVIELDRGQPEFTRTFAQYYLARVSDTRIAKGREMLAANRPLLDEVYQATGVPPRYLVAFWGLETNFGSYIGKMFVPSSLATLACDARRSKFFTEQLLTALKIVDEGDVSPEQLRGSWAGAMGQMQFMPSTFAGYAVDGDGDGRRDLWVSVPDAMHSAGRYLAGSGWVPGLRWGREVQLPEDFDYSLIGRGNRVPLERWAAAGVRDAKSQLLPSLPLESAILLPGGAQGPAFIVYENFDVIMRWNRSEFYAIAVGSLADRISGAGRLSRMPVDDGMKFSRALIRQVQQNLNRLGLDGGEVDGIFGSKSRAALRQFQTQQGLVPDGYPTMKLIEAVAEAARRINDA